MHNLAKILRPEIMIATLVKGMELSFQESIVFSLARAHEMLESISKTLEIQVNDDGSVQGTFTLTDTDVRGESVAKSGWLQGNDFSMGKVLRSCGLLLDDAIRKPSNRTPGEEPNWGPRRMREYITNFEPDDLEEPACSITKLMIANYGIVGGNIDPAEFAARQLKIERELVRILSEHDEELGSGFREFLLNRGVDVDKLDKVDKDESLSLKAIFEAGGGNTFEELLKSIDREDGSTQAEE